MDKTSLGDRMKGYENIERRYLPRRAPVIIRVDGKSFHTYTKGFERPFYRPFREAMEQTALDLANEISGCKLAYTQSDEITLLLTDDDTLETQPWFGKNLQKIVSLSAAMATYFFNKNIREVCKTWMISIEDTEELIRKSKEYEPLMIASEKMAVFDSRAFCVPREEVLNVFCWREQDCTRNATESAGQTSFSHNQLLGKSCNDIQEMLFKEKGINFNDYPTWFKRGVCAIKRPTKIQTPDGNEIERNKFILDYEIPIFNKQPEYIEDLVYHRI